MKLLLAASLCFITFISRAQTFSDWVNTVHWDGVSHWTRYMITTPGYQGPNALPVPRISDGRADSGINVSATANFHYSRGDNTQNFMLSGNYCLVKDVVSFNVNWVPYEKFDMTDEIKKQRHVYYAFYHDHEAIGEIDGNTTIQILNKYRKFIHVAIRAGYRYPSGSEYGAARNTDAPGYYFDISFGKKLSASWQWIGMAGFYCWQLESDKHRQDDAFLFGSGLEMNTRTIKLLVYGAGYLGYISDSGDKPIVLRACMEKRFHRFGWIFNFQQGINDFKYTSFETGLKFCFRPSKNSRLYRAGELP